MELKDFDNPWKHKMSYDLWGHRWVIRSNEFITREQESNWAVSISEDLMALKDNAFKNGEFFPKDSI